MQVQLYLPFVDLRYLQISLSEFIAEPNDPHNSGKLFKRCGGKMIEDNVYDCRNTITLSSKEIKGITKTNFSLFYPYGNELVGIYKIVMNIPESNKMKMPANDLIAYLNKHIDFNLRMLFEEPYVRSNAGVKDITKKTTTLVTIRNEMPRYYYLSTLRFKEKAKYNTGVKIVDPDPNLSIDNILFIDPVITLENAHKNASINGKDYYYVPRRLHVASELLRNGNLLYHFRSERNIFGNRHKMRQINEAIDNIVKCNYSLNTCICLLASFKSNFNSKMVITAIDAALESCFKVKNSFSYYYNKLGGEKKINVLRNLITKLPPGKDKKNLKDKLKKLSEIKIKETVIL